MNAANETTCQFPAIPKTVKTYKSQRAAKLAATKAEQAYELALRNRCTDEYHGGISSELFTQVNDYMSKAFDNLAATIVAVKAQGYNDQPIEVVYARNAETSRYI
jgi:hypothetical protein